MDNFWFWLFIICVLIGGVPGIIVFANIIIGVLIFSIVGSIICWIILKFIGK